MFRDNEQLINHLKKEGVLKTPRIIEAFRHIDRADFVSKEKRASAYADRPLSIGAGQTISQPYTVAFMLERLLPRPGERILDVGSGSGWTTALLSYCVEIPINKAFEVAGELMEVKKQGNLTPGMVIGVEIREKLCRFGCKNTGKYFKTFNECTDLNLEDYESFKNSKSSVAFLQADGSVGVPALAPFDAILVSASVSQVPKAWKKQLHKGGRLVFPKEGSLWKYTKIRQNVFDKEEYPGFRFVKLKEK